MNENSIGSAMFKRYLVVASGFIVPIVLIMMWEIAVRRNWFPPSFSAAPSTIAITCVKLLLSGELAKHAFLSLLRI